MTLLVTFIALLIERFFDWTHLRQWIWFEAYLNVVAKKFPNLSGMLLFVLGVLPPLILVAILQFSLQGVLYGLLSLIFQVLIVLYCFGPANFWADAFVCINAIQHGPSAEIRERVQTTFGLTLKKFSHPRLLEKMFVASHKRIFAVLFWYFILGPIGAFLYRSTDLAAQTKPTQPIDPMKDVAKIFNKCLDWLPVRIFTFLFALGGHFVKVLAIWRDHVATSYTYNDVLITKCGLAALVHDRTQKEEPQQDEQDAIALIDRTLIIVLVLLAIITLCY